MDYSKHSSPCQPLNLQKGTAAIRPCIATYAVSIQYNRTAYSSQFETKVGVTHAFGWFISARNPVHGSKQEEK
jgi:hypothetical protein